MILRRLAYAVSILSGLLLVATLVLWVRSYETTDVINIYFESTGHPAATPLVWIQSESGLAWLWDERLPPNFDPDWGDFSHTADISWRFHSIQYEAWPVKCLPSDPVFPMRFRWGLGANWLQPPSRAALPASAPLWSFALLFLFGAAPGLWTYRRRRALRRAGHCQRCSYDLTGNISGRCPECGAPTATSAAAATTDR